MKRSTMTFASAAEVETAFYDAFSRCDLEAMQIVWARDGAVCVHPGAEAIKGYVAIMRSWEHIFRDAEQPSVQIHAIQTIEGDAMAVRMVEEHIGSASTPDQSAVVFATNIYRRGDQGWLMVAHNASIMRVQQPQSHMLQ
jgi:ketosteroid isomerase-like protein